MPRKGSFMIKIDCLGYGCPIPLIKLKAKHSLILEGEKILLVTDHNLAVENIEYYCHLNKFKYSSEEVIEGVWEITISK